MKDVYVICIYREIICYKKNWLLLTEHKLMVDVIVNFWYLFEYHTPLHVHNINYWNSLFYLEEDAIGVIFSIMLYFDSNK